MNKEELLRLLENCVKTEESSIPIYCRHLGNTLFLSEFTADEKKKVLVILEMLSRESAVHTRIYKDLITKVRESVRDVY